MVEIIELDRIALSKKLIRERLVSLDGFSLRERVGLLKNRGYDRKARRNMIYRRLDSSFFN